MPRCQIADAPGVETDDAEVPALARRLLRKNKLDEIACLQRKSLVRQGQRMTGRRYRNDPDAFNVDAAKSGHVHVQLVSDADAGMAVSDRALDAAKGLHQKPNRHRRELGVEFTKQPYQPIVRQHAVDRERHFRLKLIEESTNARAQRFDAMGNRPSFGHDRFALSREFWLAGRSAIEKRKSELRLQRVDRIADGGRGAPQAFGGSRKTSRFGDAQQHQKLIDAGYGRAPHFKFPEKIFQVYTDFFGSREALALWKGGQRSFAMAKSTAVIGERPRQIVHRTHGRRHGPISRLMSPSDLGQTLKPFVFLDLFDNEGTSFSGFGLHPHSGIATLTYLLEGSVRYEDTTGATGILPQGGVEWFKAGRGAWHGGGAGDPGRTRGFQLWIALPADRELEPAESIYQSPQDIRRIGPASVLLGKLGEVSSRLPAPSPVNYLAVRLKAGESWRYQPPADHAVCWIALSSGSLAVPEPVQAGELAAFEPSNEAIDFHAETDTEFVLGSAASHPYELALGNYSVHTSPASLQAGERHIAELKARLQKEGLL